MFPFRARLLEKSTGYLIGLVIVILVSTYYTVVYTSVTFIYSFNQFSMECIVIIQESDQFKFRFFPLCNVVLLILCNIVIIISTVYLIYKSVKIKKAHRANQNRNSKGIVAVLSVSIVFFICTIPQMVFYTWVSYILVRRGRDLFPSFQSMLSYVILYSYLPYINAVANIFIYWLTIASFRNFLTTWWRNQRSRSNSIQQYPSASTRNTCTEDI